MIVQSRGSLYYQFTAFVKPACLVWLDKPGCLLLSASSCYKCNRKLANLYFDVTNLAHIRAIHKEVGNTKDERKY